MKITDQDRKIIRRIVLVFKPYARNIVMIIFILLISSALSMISPLVNRHIIDNGLLVSNFGVVVKYTILSMSIIIINQGLGLLETKYCVHLSNMIPYELTKRTFKHALWK